MLDKSMTFWELMDSWDAQRGVALEGCQVY